jgi:cytochrome c oxidase assembly protein subunit 15
VLRCAGSLICSNSLTYASDLKAVVSLQTPLHNCVQIATDIAPPPQGHGLPQLGGSSDQACAASGLQRTLTLLTGHLVVALVALVVIGGTTRVMEAGLACPDWPLCYGALLPGRQMNLQVFLEWFHRLDAFLVGLALLVLSALSLVYRSRLPGWLPWLSAGALLLVAAQGLLGALTVVHLLEASTVTAHLATALLLVLLLSGLHQRLLLAFSQPAAPAVAPATPLWWRFLLVAPVLLVLAQCVLGGAMASQWSADLCFAAGEACSWLLAHRLLAYPAALSVLLLALGSLLLRAPAEGAPLQPMRGLALAGAGLVVLQVLLGVTTLRLALAVPAVTVAHQLVAALLVAVLGALLGRSWPGSGAFTQSNLEVDHG